MREWRKKCQESYRDISSNSRKLKYETVHSAPKEIMVPKPYITERSTNRMTSKELLEYSVQHTAE